MTSVFIAGRGLVSSLGPDLPAALAQIERGDITPAHIDFGTAGNTPYYAIAQQGTDWYARVHELVAQVVAQAGGPQARDLPLFVASSSLDAGAIEAGAERGPDCNAFAARIAGHLDWQGPVYTVSTACTASLTAMLSASSLIQAGASTGALILGVELANRFTVGGFSAMQLLAPERALPFGMAREGLVLGEAVVALRLTNQPGRWRIKGGANVVDGRDPTGAVKQAVVSMCKQALATSGLHAKDIGLIKVQAAGSPTGDATEADALAQVFTDMPPLVSLKAVLGHTLGASGAAEIALLTACLENECLPPANYQLDDALGITLTGTLQCPARYVLASILGFGGGHAALILEDTEAVRS